MGPFLAASRARLGLLSDGGENPWPIAWSQGFSRSLAVPTEQPQQSGSPRPSPVVLTLGPWLPVLTCSPHTGLQGSSWTQADSAQGLGPARSPQLATGFTVSSFGSEPAVGILDQRFVSGTYHSAPPNAPWPDTVGRSQGRAPQIS